LWGKKKLDGNDGRGSAARVEKTVPGSRGSIKRRAPEGQSAGLGWNGAKNNNGAFSWGLK